MATTTLRMESSALLSSASSSSTRKAGSTIGFRASTCRTFNGADADYNGRGFPARLKSPNHPNAISFRLEAYEQLSHIYLQGDEEAPRQGFALVGEKKIRNFSGDFGFASIDRNYGLYSGSSLLQEAGFSLNGDSFNPGIRIFSHASYKLTSVITAFGFYTRITGKMIPSLNAQGLNAGLSFDLKTRANTHTRIFQNFRVEHHRDREVDWIHHCGPPQT